MAKRFTATEIWGEDWFLDMPNEYKLFWYYMMAECDHAGLFRVNLRSFCSLNEVKIESTKALNYFNLGKGRLRVISSSIWLIEDFFFYQYGHTFNINNRVHNSVLQLYIKYNIELWSIRGLKEVILDLKGGVKDKDKDKDNNTLHNKSLNGQKNKKISPEWAEMLEKIKKANPDVEHLNQKV